MAKNYIQKGATITMIAPSAVASGEVIVENQFVGIAKTDAESGEEVEVCIEGVWEVPKMSAQAWSVGETVYWNSSANAATAASSGNTKMGYATEVAPNPSSVGRVKIWP